MVKEKDKRFLVALAVLIVLASFFLYKPQSIVSLDQIKIEQNGKFSGNWWVGHFIVNDPNGMIGILNKETTNILDGKDVKTQSKIAVELIPERPYTQYGLSPATYYIYSITSYDDWGNPIVIDVKISYRDVVSPATHTPFKAQVKKNDVAITDWISLDVYPNAPFNLKLVEGVIVELLGQLSRGVVPPSAGTYIQYTDPWGTDHLYIKSDFVAACERFKGISVMPWEDHYQVFYQRILSTYPDYINSYAKDLNKNQNYLKLLWDTSAVVADVTVWISTYLADTVYVTYPSVKAKIVEVTQVNPTFKSGIQNTIKVKVQNIGTTAGTIAISISSNDLIISPASQGDVLQVNEIREFNFIATGGYTTATKSISYTVFAQGNEGSDTKGYTATLETSVIIPTPTPTLTPIIPTPTPTPPPDGKPTDVAWFIWLFAVALVIGILYGYIDTDKTWSKVLIVSALLSIIIIFFVSSLVALFTIVASWPIIGGFFKGLVDSAVALAANVILSVVVAFVGVVGGTVLGDLLEKRGK